MKTVTQVFSDNRAVRSSQSNRAVFSVQYNREVESNCQHNGSLLCTRGSDSHDQEFISVSRKYCTVWNQWSRQAEVDLLKLAT
mmetsp:Transcript_8232/g.27672  ORF Transcript_8232/g.27672 Transcript_8232/m.27672 type:complete len:83 (+) Transcript_8232:85-333(+)